MDAREGVLPPNKAIPTETNPASQKQNSDVMIVASKSSSLMDVMTRLSELTGEKIDNETVQSLAEHESRLTSLNDPCRRLLEHIYRPDINDFDISRPEGEKLTYTSIFEGFFSGAIDSGLLQKRQFIDPEGKTHEVKGAPAFRRGSFVDLISKRAGVSYRETGWNLDEDVSFTLYDIKDFRSADKAEDANGNSAADYLLNRSVDTINTIIEASPYKDKIYVCRYGGDELVIGGVGLTVEELAKINADIKGQITQIDGWYKDTSTGQIAKKKVELNEEKQHTFSVSKDQIGLRKSIFLSYFKKGLLLSNEEVEKAISRYRIKDIEPHSIYKPDVFPEGETNSNTIREIKIKYICENNPQLMPLIEFARIIDTAESQKGDMSTHKRVETMLHFIENVIYDPLLEYNIYSFTDFAENLRTDKFKMIRTIDFKFVKEINDKYSMVEGDESIRTAWLKISGVMEKFPELRSKLRIGRRGGSFFIGMDASHQLTDKELSELNEAIAQNLQDVTLDIRGDEITVPLGLSSFTDVERRPDEKESDKKYMDRVMQETLTQAENDWFGKALKHRFVRRERPSEEGRMQEYVDTSSVPGKAARELWDLFFNGKRRIERVAKLKENKTSQQKGEEKYKKYQGNKK